MSNESKSAPWYASLGEVAAFARAMVDAGEFDARDVCSYVEKPWKWTDERDHWVLTGRGEVAVER